MLEYCGNVWNFPFYTTIFASQITNKRTQERLSDNLPNLNISNCKFTTVFLFPKRITNKITNG